MKKTLIHNLFIFAVVFIPFCIHSFVLDRVILTSDNNPLYSEFWPVIARVWQQLIGVRPTLIFIDDGSAIEFDDTCGDVIRFKAIPDIPTAFQAQVIRLLAPVLFKDEICIISDIDMLPLSRSYFVDTVKKFNDTSCVVYRPYGYDKRKHRYPMCYIAAKGLVFGDIFQVSNVEDIRDMIIQWYEQKLGWITDELMLYKYIHAWKNFAGHCMLLQTKRYRRLHRDYWKYHEDGITKGLYADAHLPRPYSHYKNEIDAVICLLDLPVKEKI
ncbi:MAG: hypothetical protein WA432_04530 [Candidatus Babeliaceae bacterium]